jgi:thiamine biosynthesis lipoprotein
MSAQTSRRRFLRGSLLLAATQGARAAPLAERVTRHGLAFGTHVSVTVAGLAPARAAAAAAAALAEIAAIEQQVSLHAGASALARLNREGRLVATPPALRELLQQARRWGATSGGAFDVTVQPLWQAYFAAAARGGEPGGAEIERARALIGWQAVELAGTDVRFTRPQTRVTLNGLAQGYASDRAWAVLQAHGAAHALVDAGEWRAGSVAPGRPWRIGVRDPLHDGDAMAPLIDLVELDHGALASSGADGYWFTPAHHTHHILDPHTGRSPSELAGSTVFAADATTADALSTACMVLGVERGLELVARSAAQALLVRRDGRMVASAGWPGARRRAG